MKKKKTKSKTLPIAPRDLVMIAALIQSSNDVFHSLNVAGRFTLLRAFIGNLLMQLSDAEMAELAGHAGLPCNKNGCDCHAVDAVFVEALKALHKQYRRVAVQAAAQIGISIEPAPKITGNN